MTKILKKAWQEVIQPLVQRPKMFQVAALCYRGKGNEREVLLITTRGTGRWLLPKGWPIDGLDAHEAACQEAWEEAGVRASNVGDKPVGEFRYVKHYDEGFARPCSAKVYPVKVKRLADKFPEKGLRKRQWVPLSKAADMVEEESLREILRAF